MEKFDCKNCIYGKKGVYFILTTNCSHCIVDSKDIHGKPICYKENKKQTEYQEKFHII